MKYVLSINISTQIIKQSFFHLYFYIPLAKKTRKGYRN